MEHRLYPMLDQEPDEYDEEEYITWLKNWLSDDRILTERYEDTPSRFCACGNLLTLHDRETGQVVCKECR